LVQGDETAIILQSRKIALGVFQEGPKLALALWILSRLRVSLIRLAEAVEKTGQEGFFIDVPRDRLGILKEDHHPPEFIVHQDGQPQSLSLFDQEGSLEAGPILQGKFLLLTHLEKREALYDLIQGELRKLEDVFIISGPLDNDLGPALAEYHKEDSPGC
jgi:hypothetical protein